MQEMAGAGPRQRMIRNVADSDGSNPAAGPGEARAAWHHTASIPSARTRILLAGPLTEAKFLNQPLRSLAAVSDLSKCEQIAWDLLAYRQHLMGLIRLPQLDPTALLNEQKRRVRRWLGRPDVWSVIRPVAGTLERRGVLYEDDLLLSVTGAVGPTPQHVLRLYEPTPADALAQSRAPSEGGRQTAA